jgi:ankyrin repeat protein
MHLAAGQNQLNTAQLLLTNRADVNVRDKKGWTPLFSAVKNGNSDMMTLLVANKADVNARNDEGETPLVLPVTNGDKHVAELLVSSKADVNAQNNKGDTLLHLAVSKNHMALAELLLANQAEIDGQNNEGNTPLLLAAAFNDPVRGTYLELAKLLLTHKANVNTRSLEGNAALHLAIKKRDTEFIKLLLGNQADVNVKDMAGNTPLHMAVNWGNERVVEMLISNGADVKSKNDEATTPLAMADSRTIWNLLRRHGGRDLPTEFSYAASDGDIDKLKAMVAANPDLARAAGAKGRTPLCWASEGGWLNAAEFLLAKGAEIDAGGQNGNAPLDAALANGQKTVVNLLLTKGADVRWRERSWGDRFKLLKLIEDDPRLILRVVHSFLKDHLEVEMWLETLADDDYSPACRDSKWAAQLLARLQLSEIHRAVIPFLKHDKSSIRRGAVYILGYAATPEALSTICGTLSDSDLWVRCDSAKILSIAQNIAALPDQGLSIVEAALRYYETSQSGHEQRCMAALIETIVPAAVAKIGTGLLVKIENLKDIEIGIDYTWDHQDYRKYKLLFSGARTAASNELTVRAHNKTPDT